MIAKAAFDQVVKSVIMASGISYHLQMGWPSKAAVSEIDNTLLISKDSGVKAGKSYFVESLTGHALPLFSPSRVSGCLDIIQRLENLSATRLINLYCIGIRLQVISPSAGYIEFIKIVEWFIDKKYRKMFETSKEHEQAEMHSKLFSFEKGLREMVKKHFSTSENSEHFVSNILSEARRRFFLSYSNKELLKYTCKESGFYDFILDERKRGLESLINETYSYWTETRRKQHIEEILKEHEKLILTVSKELFRIRAPAAHLITDNTEADSYIEREGALPICAMLARYLLDKLLDGSIKV